MTSTARAADPLARLRARPEREIQTAILAYLRTRPDVTAWRQNVGAVTARGRTVRFGFPGLSDIIGFKSVQFFPTTREEVARFLAIECKREGEKPTPAQAAFLKAVRDAGGLAIVATCVADVANALGPVGG